MVGELKQSTITLAGDNGKKPAYFILGEECDLRWCRGVLSVFHESDSIAVLSDSCSRPRGKHSPNRLM